MTSVSLQGTIRHKDVTALTVDSLPTNLSSPIALWTAPKIGCLYCPVHVIESSNPLSKIVSYFWPTPRLSIVATSALASRQA